MLLTRQEAADSYLFSSILDTLIFQSIQLQKLETFQSNSTTLLQLYAMTCRSTSDVSAFSERSVSFSTIEFHEHAMILGCSPSTSEGPPLEIDWNKLNTSTFSLEDYEELRPPRRIRNQLIMPGFVREEV